MPTLKGIVWPTSKVELLELGKRRVERFCMANKIDCPSIESVAKSDWIFDACAYYRPSYIKICTPNCAYPCSEAQTRNWNWPGSTTDREPYGVLCHELGHHCDWYASENKGKYYGDYSKSVFERANEPAITSYAPNWAEWFAEMFRLFVTNHGLLKEIRPKTYNLLRERWEPVGTSNWRKVLGNAPVRIIRTLINKGAI